LAAKQPPTQDWPAIIYGTAWKEERTADLTYRALGVGLRAIDTAGQPKHYNEAGVGIALTHAREGLDLERGDLFLQSKFTPLRGQGADIPYDRDADPREQVRQSLAQSLANLGTDYLDSYLLHAPTDPRRLTDTDRAIWSEMEAALERGTVRHIGISNAAPHHIEAFAQEEPGRVPQAVQNRCFAHMGWDRDMRAVCARYGIAYQGFSLLTANSHIVKDATVSDLADRHDVSPTQLIFAFARAMGMIPLTGTTRDMHMIEDLAALDVALDPETLSVLERIGLR